MKIRDFYSLYYGELYLGGIAMKIKYEIGKLLFNTFTKWARSNKIPYVIAMDVTDNRTNTIGEVYGYDARIIKGCLNKAMRDTIL